MLSSGIVAAWTGWSIFSPRALKPHVFAQLPPHLNFRIIFTVSLEKVYISQYGYFRSEVAFM